MNPIPDVADHPARILIVDAAWLQLSIEAGTLIDVLRRHATSAKEPSSCAS